MALDDKVLQIGEMPKPEYLREAGDTTGSGNIKWVGVRAYGLDQELGDFLWWRNFKGDLNDSTDRYNTAAFVARLKLETGAEAVIGPAIDLSGSNQRKNYVAKIEEPNVLGVYVEADKRPMFNFMSMMNGVKSEAELRAQKPVEFDEIFQKAKVVLPYGTKVQETPKKSVGYSANESSLVRRVGDTGLYVVEGDLTQEPSDAIMTAINSGGMWFGGIDGAIQRVAEDHYHSQASKAMPLRDLQVIVARGNRENHRGQFNDVVFVVDDLQNPLNRVVYAGLETAHREGYEKIAVPTIRMGVMAGAVEKTPKETVARMSEGINQFMHDYGGQTGLRNVTFVVYRDPATMKTLQEGLAKVARSH